MLYKEKKNTIIPIKNLKGDLLERKIINGKEIMSDIMDSINGLRIFLVSQTGVNIVKLRNLKDFIGQIKAENIKETLPIGYGYVQNVIGNMTSYLEKGTHMDNIYKAMIYYK